MSDKFFTQTKCDRCKGDIESIRKMSWFTEECLCLSCSDKERDYRDSLEAKGINTYELEGCNYMPKIETGGK